MKQGWEIKKLGEVGTFQRGGGFLKSDFVENGFPCIHYGQIHTRLGVKTYKHLTCITEELAFSKSKIAHSGDVIIAITSEDVEGSCKCTAWLGGYDVAVGAHAAIYRHNLNPAFVAYYFNGAHFNFEKIKYARGFKVVEIKPSDIEKISIKFPSLEEQERIVAELDCLSGVIEHKREQLRELDALAQSIFYQMFGDPITNEKGWQVKKLKNITSKIGSGATPKGGNESYKDEGISLIRSLNVHNNLFVYKDLAHIDDEQASALRNVVVEDGDVLLNITGASVARCCVVPNDVLPARVNQHVAIIRPMEMVSNVFICYQFTSNAYQQELLSIGKSNGATREALTKGQLEELDIIMPPISLQQQFADRIEKIEQQKELIKKSIEETENLFNARMDYYFN